jgi:hypothetical protein
MSDNVANTPVGDVPVETTRSKKPSYTVEISQFENGQFNPIRIPCEVVDENTTSYRVRVKLPSGEVRIIRKNKTKVFSDQPKIEKPKEDPKKEKVEKKEKKSRKSTDSAPTPTSQKEKPKRNGRVPKS